MSKGKVLIAAPVHRMLLEELERYGYDLIVSEKITQPLAFDLLKNCVGIITSTRLQLDKELLDAAPLLQWIGRMGSGMEVIDMAYAASKGIKCFSSPEGNCNAVAEHALGLLLSLTKHITWSHNEVMEGKWLREENRGIELEEKTIGIIGFGHTGRAFAKKLSSFDMRILAYDKYHQNNFPPYVKKCKSLQPIFDEADIVSFHVPLLEETFHYFDEVFIAQMKKPFILLNTSRGNVVDTYAMYAGLKKNKITGACLDVIEGEPLEQMSREQRKMLEEMLTWPQVLITPHIAGYSNEALYKMSRALFDKIVMYR